MDELADITSAFATADNLHRVRSNEVLLGARAGLSWEMREFALRGAPRALVSAPMTNTPPISMNGSTGLRDWMTSHATSILAGDNALPLEDLAQTAPVPSATFTWNAPGASRDSRRCAPMRSTERLATRGAWARAGRVRPHDGKRLFHPLEVLETAGTCPPRGTSRARKTRARPPERTSPATFSLFQPPSGISSAKRTRFSARLGTRDLRGGRRVAVSSSRSARGGRQRGCFERRLRRSIRGPWRGALRFRSTGVEISSPRRTCRARRRRDARSKQLRRRR